MSIIFPNLSPLGSKSTYCGSKNLSSPASKPLNIASCIARWLKNLLPPAATIWLPTPPPMGTGGSLSGCV